MRYQILSYKTTNHNKMKNSDALEEAINQNKSIIY